MILVHPSVIERDLVLQVEQDTGRVAMVTMAGKLILIKAQP